MFPPYADTHNTIHYYKHMAVHNYTVILKIQKYVIPFQIFMILSVSLDLNLIILLTLKPNKFTHVLYLKIVFCPYQLYRYNGQMYVGVCLSVCGSQEPAGNKDGGLKLGKEIEDA
jgi:hypothetical protein